MHRRNHSLDGSTSLQKLADAGLDFGPRPAEAHAARFDQPVGVRPPRAGRIVEVEADRRGRGAASQQPRPGREVRKIEQRIGSAEADLLGEDRRVDGAGPAGDDRAGIAEHRIAEPVGKLVEVLVPDGQREGILARLTENEREALGGERLELVGVEMEHAAIGSRGVGAGEGGLGDGGGEERPEQMGGALAKPAFGEVADHDRALVHEAAQGDGALGLRQHVAQARLHQRLADLVLDRGDGFGAETVAIAGILVEPERAHHRIADMVRDELHAERFVDEQAGKHEQAWRRARRAGRARRW